MNKMSTVSRIVVALASLSLIATFFLPMWFIFLLAPQYPEGLTMKIWLDKITGQVEIINGLNHYIGMKQISANMFPEFQYLRFIMAGFIVVGLLVAVIGKRKLLFVQLLLLLAGAIAAMVDFYKWGYDYGHNLDPHAAIKVPGLSYQPPLVGHKTLLNFDAYSYPDIGGWIVIGVSVLLFIVWFLEYRRSRKPAPSSTTAMKAAPVAALAILTTLTSCTAKPEPIQYGKDLCSGCHMTIMDPKYGGEVVTKKGKVYKFDDAHCLVRFLKSGTVQQADIAHTLLSDFEKEKEFIEAEKAVFVNSPQLKSPMGSNTAAFTTKEAAEKQAGALNGKVLDWKAVYAAQ